MRLEAIEKKYLSSVGLLSLLCVALVVVRVLATHTSRYWFIVENLGLAWLSLIFVWLLGHELKNRRWLSWQSLSLTILWLAFLPNTWYVLTDFIHVQPTGEINLLFDIVMMSTLVFSGFILGFTSLYLMHRQLLKRLLPITSHTLVGLVLLLCSFAIYLGRDLRWSTWDIITNPSGIVLNISDRVVDPLGHIHAVNITGLFFVLLSVIYISIYIFFRPPPTRN